MNFKKELDKIFEEELSGKTTNAGRIYRKLRARDKEFIRKLKEDYKFKILTLKGEKYISVKDYVRFVDFIDKLAGDNLK